jgi:hypothetical protein
MLAGANVLTYCCSNWRKEPKATHDGWDMLSTLGFLVTLMAEIV